MFSARLSWPGAAAAFLRWYVWSKPRSIVQCYLAYLDATGEIFSFVFLLRTLFAPWKSIHDEYARRGLSVSAYLEVVTFNIFSRVVGSVVRLAAFIVGLVCQALLLVLFASYLVLWIAFPFVLFYGLALLVQLS